jgi:predicted transcriptional regulator
MKDILKVATNGANITAIIRKARLNYSMSKHYLMLAHDNEYIQHENGMFFTTEKGKVFIETANEFDIM